MTITGGAKSSDDVCPNCKGTKRALYFGEQSWSHEERVCHLCRPSEPPAVAESEAVAAIKEAIDCITDLGSGKGGWAWEEVIQRLALFTTGNA